MTASMALLHPPARFSFIICFNISRRLYMLLELVQGGELFSRLQNANAPGRINAAEARFYAACVLDALDYMHAQGILYR